MGGPEDLNGADDISHKLEPTCIRQQSISPGTNPLSDSLHKTFTVLFFESRCDERNAQICYRKVPFCQAHKLRDLGFDFRLSSTEIVIVFSQVILQSRNGLKLLH